MITVPLYNIEGMLLEEIEVDEARLGGSVNRDLLRQAILAFEANQRAGTAKAKGRGEVKHVDRKPWRQKGTGRARAGSRNSPLWRGGGVTFGPVPRDYTQKLNKKMRRGALRSALLAKLLDREVKLLDRLEPTEAKTREMARILRNLSVERTFLIVLPQHDAALWRCTRNILGAAVAVVGDLNPYQVVRARDVIILREAFDRLLDAPPPPAALAAEAQQQAPGAEER